MKTSGPKVATRPPTSTSSRSHFAPLWKRTVPGGCLVATGNVAVSRGSPLGRGVVQVRRREEGGDLVRGRLASENVAVSRGSPLGRGVARVRRREKGGGLLDLWVGGR